MRKLRLGIIACVWVLAVTVLAAAQGYQPPTHVNPKDVYCSGFWSHTKLAPTLQIVMGEDAVGRTTFSQYDYVYLGEGQNGGLSVGQRYLVVRAIKNPNPMEGFHTQNYMLLWKWQKQYVGQLYADIGRVQVVGVGSTTATALVTDACDGLRRGDFLIPYEERPEPAYKASDKFNRFAPPSGKAEGTMVMGKDFAYTVGQGDAVYVNVGASDGVKVGDYIRFYRPADGSRSVAAQVSYRGDFKSHRGVVDGYEIPTARRYDLPREVLGEGLVVRTDEKGSTVIVTLSLMEIHAGDYVELE